LPSKAVAELMTQGVASARSDHRIDAVGRTLTELKGRRAVVVDADDQLVGEIA
jgi:CBS domain-containing protein